MGDFINEKLSIAEKIMNLQTELLQDVIDSILSIKYDNDWVQKVYVYGKNLQNLNILDNNQRKAKDKYTEFVKEVDKLASIERVDGRIYATKNLLDTTVMCHIIIYNEETKGFFSKLGPDFAKHIRNLTDGRNSIKHKLDRLSQYDEKDQITIYYGLCGIQIAELHSFLDSLSINQKYILKDKKVFLDRLRSKIFSLDEIITKEHGAALVFSHAKENLANTISSHFQVSPDFNTWLETEMNYYYMNPVDTADRVELFIKSIESKIAKINYLHILEEIRLNNEVENYVNFFSETFLENFYYDVASKEDNYLKYSDYLDETSDFINEICNSRSASKTEAIENIMTTLAIMLDICYFYKNSISQIYEYDRRKKAINIYQYSSKIMNQFAKDKETYVDIPWTIQNEDKDFDDDDNNIIHIEDIINNKRMRLCGEAGCGKSTALSRLTYLTAEKVCNGESECIPVFVELKKLDASNNIYCEMQKILGVNYDIVKSFLQSGEIVLFFDGNDEIKDSNIKRDAAAMIDNITKEYPNVSVYLSDRYINSIPPVMIKYPIAEFRRMNLDVVLKIINAYCHDEEVKMLLQSKCKSNHIWLSEFDTPMKLLSLIKLVLKTREIPYDFTKEYLEFLFVREANEKKEIHLYYVKKGLEILALFHDNEMKQMEAERKIGSLLSNQHYMNISSVDIINIAEGMGIIKRIDDHVIAFSDKKYKDYYEAEALLDLDLETLNNK